MLQVIQLRKACSHPYLFPGIEPEPYEEGEHLVEVAFSISYNHLVNHNDLEVCEIMCFSNLTTNNNENSKRKQICLS